MNHFNRCQFCLNLDQVQNYGPHCKQCADDRYTHKTDQTMKSRHTLLGQFPHDIWSKCLSSIECITLYSVSVLSSPIVGCCWAGSVISTYALLFPGYFSQCNIINFFCVSEPCHLGQWASCVLRSRQLDTTLKLLCAVSAWKGSSTFSRGEYLSTNHSTFQTYVSEPCHLGQWAS